MKIIAFKRIKKGTGFSRNLRKIGKIPGIIYGGNKDPVKIIMNHNMIYYALKKEIFHSSILNLEIHGKVELVLLRNFQLHAYKKLVLHADFQRVDTEKKIHVKVPLHFINSEISPAIKLHSCIISHVISDLYISCLPKDLPKFIEINLEKMEVNTSIHLSNIKLPKGITVIHSTEEDPTIATAIIPANTLELENNSSTEKEKNSNP
ncbi:50S ribosomal protein L25 [Candidatus Profftella armatura (Diaphorina cf. continua)]|uniref:Large ribosomal subunit protein bL25 n=1 Tax=Candidatus Profftella armatura (Diaphorina cf. continua) TaxID=2661583 RepID=A0A7R7AC98_9PROT|nr:50S ribosomal protein L25/general stress protein Ctc [Candidatus Profftella armatura (Diaphorina cf. continua)]BCG49605.1 50S ribosomal protein L25 [Candidatus Profftella armatura (Diaphorina cf. continua)]